MPVSDRMDKEATGPYSMTNPVDNLAGLSEREEDAYSATTVLPPLPQRRSSAPQAGISDFSKYSLQVLPAPLAPLAEKREPAGSNSASHRFSAEAADTASESDENLEARADSVASEFTSPTSPGLGRADTDWGRDTASLPPLPQLRTKRVSPVFVSFLVCVVAPLAAIGVYLFAFASDQYVAEFRFSVTESNPVSGGGSVAPPQGAANAVISSTASALLGGTSVTSASPQNYVVVDYLKSRQALDDIQRRINLREMFSKPDIDWWQRFEKGGIEKFADYWSGVVSANYDPVTGLAIAKVKAFSAPDALLIAQTLVTLSEDLVNSIARRTQADAVQFAEGEVARAQKKLKDVRQEVLEFRTAEGVIDPSLGVVPANIELVKQLRANLVQAQTDLATLRGQKLQSGASVSQALVSRIAATKEELAKAEREVSKDRDGARALAEIMARFERLDLDRQYAQSMLISALQAYDQARAYAAAQHLYLTPYVRPTLPETATYPRRVLTMLLSMCALFGIWLSGLTIYRSIRDHAF